MGGERDADADVLPVRTCRQAVGGRLVQGGQCMEAGGSDVGGGAGLGLEASQLVSLPSRITCVIPTR
jgi:hypothetical protein